MFPTNHKVNSTFWKDYILIQRGDEVSLLSTPSLDQWSNFNHKIIYCNWSFKPTVLCTLDRNYPVWYSADERKIKIINNNNNNNTKIGLVRIFFLGISVFHFIFFNKFNSGNLFGNEKLKIHSDLSNILCVLSSMKPIN